MSEQAPNSQPGVAYLTHRLRSEQVSGGQARHSPIRTHAGNGPPTTNEPHSQVQHGLAGRDTA